MLKPIESTSEEQTLFEFMIDFGRAYRAEQERRGHRVVLKGGTALKLACGLPRPSTDLDFEGTAGHHQVLPAARRAAKALPARWSKVKVWRPLWRWLLSPGTVRIIAYDETTKKWIKTKVDHRKLGSRPGIPRQIDGDDVHEVQGIEVYGRRTVMQRKLEAFLGTSKRMAARDAYDATWIRQEHADCMTNNQKDAMDQWADTMVSDEQAAERWRELFESDEVMRRTNLKHIVETIQELAQTERINTTLKTMTTRRGNQARRDQERAQKATPAAAPTVTTKRPQQGGGQGWDR